MPAGPLFNPFPGLRPFEPDEDHLFFGREKEIDELLRRLRANQFLSVVGTSGCGKSSLVRCGLIPSLHSGFMVKAGSTWRVATLRPGEGPIGQLAVALNGSGVLGTEGEMASTNRVLLEATLRRGTRGLVDVVRQARIPPEDNLLVIVDQFEELFRFRRSRHIENSRDEAVAFVKLLLEAAQQHEAPIYIVLTMRSDFIGECIEYPGLPEAVNAGQYLVPRMTRDELRSAITGPIAVAGGEITPRLVLRLLNDLGDDNDQLPVLQHALMRTWDHWERHQSQGEPIDVADYEAVGTMQQALSLHAEEAFLETGSDANRKIAQRIFKALTDTFSDPRGIRRPTSIKRLSAICEAQEQEVIQIVEIFRRPGRSFVMPPASTLLESRSIVDLSHESLMRCWTRLITWAEEERASARVYARLSQASAWFAEGTAGLWHNPELELGVRWKQQNQPTEAWAERYDSTFARAMDFLDRSEKEQGRVEAERENARKNKLRLAWSVAGALGVLLLVALYFYHVAQTESRRAEANLGLASKAVDESLSSAGNKQGRESPDPPQLEQFRQELLKKAEVFYSNFLIKQAKNSFKFQADSAQVHSKLGDINRLLEKWEDAVVQYRLAIGGFAELHRLKPGNAEYSQDLAYAHHWLGETLRLRLERTQNPPYTRSEAAEAEMEYDSALRLQQNLHQAVPENTDYAQALARTYYNRGILTYDANDLAATEASFREAVRLLAPLAEKEPQSQIEDDENPPSHDLARVYNDLGNLLGDQGHPSLAQESFERAIKIQTDLTRKSSKKWEYEVELAKFYNNVSFLLWSEGEDKLAAKKNHEALDLLEDLSTPVPSLEGERAKAHMLNLAMGSSEHPEFHVLYKHLAEQYFQLATEYFKLGSPDAAKLAIDALGSVLPKVAEPDRTKLANSYQDLQKQLQESKNKRRP
jgi:tetratricopeptide (TPR) repeat protein/energy-coupling factor transporter ATP-binding protein EcfA2